MTDFILRDEKVRATAMDLIARLDLSRPWQITVSRYVKKRSLSQNSLFHKWCTIIANKLGDDMDSVKSELKSMFLEKVERMSQITGEITMVPKRTRDLNTQEMTDFMMKVQAFAASQLGILLPLPEEQHLRVA